MKKRTSVDIPVVDAELMESAKRYVFDSKPRPTFKCRVCDEPGASEESEGLCWVCRRLKISAWHEIETQMPIAE